jgi:hypothetical protein
MVMFVICPYSCWVRTMKDYCSTTDAVLDQHSPLNGSLQGTGVSNVEK